VPAVHPRGPAGASTRSCWRRAVHPRGPAGAEQCIHEVLQVPSHGAAGASSASTRSCRCIHAVLLAPSSASTRSCRCRATEPRVPAVHPRGPAGAEPWRRGYKQCIHEVLQVHPRGPAGAEQCIHAVLLAPSIAEQCIHEVLQVPSAIRTGSRFTTPRNSTARHNGTATNRILFTSRNMRCGCRTCLCNWRWKIRCRRRRRMYRLVYVSVVDRCCGDAASMTHCADGGVLCTGAGC
jgi:hypothetical protein